MKNWAFGAVISALSICGGIALPAAAGDLLTDSKSGCKVQSAFQAEGLEVQWSGTCTNGMAAGKGTLTWIVKDQVAVKDIGTFEDGALEGSGMRENIFWKSTYKGSFHAGLFEGNGRLELTNGTVYDGEWKAGKQNGVGRFEFNNGNVYEGTVKNGLKIGHGKFTWSDTTYFEGEFVNDQPEGDGMCRDKNGKVAACTFADGEFQAWK